MRVDSRCAVHPDFPVGRRGAGRWRSGLARNQGWVAAMERSVVRMPPVTRLAEVNDRRETIIRNLPIQVDRAPKTVIVIASIIRGRAWPIFRMIRRWLGPGRRRRGPSTPGKVGNATA